LSRVTILACSLILLAGCGTTSGNAGKSVPTPVVPVTCIGVLPAVPGIDLERKITSEEQKTLVQGAKVMNRYLSQELAGQDKIVLLTDDYLSGIKMTGGESSVEVARLIGGSINCNAILETKIWRYSERIGNKWSVEQPASVAFEFRLIGTDNGSLLWSARFDEQQIAVMENLYNWSKAKTRGFTWITADELMLEGMREKIANSPYFKQIMKKEPPPDAGDYLEDKI